MSTRTLAIALTGAAVIVVVAACQTSNAPTVATTLSATAVSTTLASTTSTSVPSSSATPASATPTIMTATRQPCDLLTPAIAKKYVGDNAQRQFFYLDSNPPLPLGDDACSYAGDARSVSVAIFPRPTDPTVPVNHFDVIEPQHQVAALGFEAYWFGPGESIVAVKDGLLIELGVAITNGSWTDQDRADDIELANLIVPQVK